MILSRSVALLLALALAAGCGGGETSSDGAVVYVDLNFTQVSDLTPLANLKSLEQLFLPPRRLAT